MLAGGTGFHTLSVSVSPMFCETVRQNITKHTINSKCDCVESCRMCQKEHTARLS